VPAYLQFGTNENIGDVILNTDLGWVVGEKYEETTGTHGFDPFFPDMHVNFRAIGPDFKTGYVKEDIFQNINVYSLMCHLLGLTPAPNDGCLEVVSDMLK
jgi:predicted AlkP superfamily pyrophosphatase or phosphodiesterase